MPVLDNALEAGIMAFAPLLFAARFLPLTVSALRWRDPAGPARPRAVLGGDRARHLQPAAPTRCAAAVHGIFFGRVAPSSAQRRAGSRSPALVVGHPADPIHPAADAAMLAAEMPNARSSGPAASWSGGSAPERLTPLAAELRALAAGTPPRPARGAGS